MSSGTVLVLLLLQPPADRLQLVKGPCCAAWETCFDTQKDPDAVAARLRGQTHLKCHYSLLSSVKVVISVLKKNESGTVQPPDK